RCRQSVGTWAARRHIEGVAPLVLGKVLMEANLGEQSTGKRRVQDGTIFAVIAAVSVCHLLNDTIQSLVPAVYPILKTTFHLHFGSIGLLPRSLQLTASLLQPIVGHYTDRRPQPYSLAVGMGFTLAGLVLLSIAANFAALLVAAALIGMGSSVFHPESSRV